MPSRRPRKRAWGAPVPPLDLERARGGLRHESAPDGDWSVRTVRGEKTYTCPGCSQSIPPGTVHLVVWQDDSILGDQAALDLRRHWHASCWSARERRRPR